MAHRAAKNPQRDAEAVTDLDHVIDFGLAQLLDDAAGFEGINLGRVLFWHADLGEQSGVGFCRVRDRRFRHAAPQLLHDDLAFFLAVDPLLIGREAHANRLHALGRAQVDGDG